MGKLVGNKYGIHRVIEPQGVLTQAAQKIDNDMSKKYSNEIICDVISLNIDSASFTQIEEACDHDVEKIKQMILDIVNERGKMQNPATSLFPAVTNSAYSLRISIKALTMPSLRCARVISLSVISIFVVIIF